MSGKKCIVCRQAAQSIGAMCGPCAERSKKEVLGCIERLEDWLWQISEHGREMLKQVEWHTKMVESGRCHPGIYNQVMQRLQTLSHIARGIRDARYEYRHKPLRQQIKDACPNVRT